MGTACCVFSLNKLVLCFPSLQALGGAWCTEKYARFLSFSMHIYVFQREKEREQLKPSKKHPREKKNMLRRT